MSAVRPASADPSRVPVVTLVSRDGRLTAEVRRLCAPAGFELSVVTGRSDVMRAWRGTAPVLLDAEALDLAPVGGAPRRADAVILATDVDRIEVWRTAARLGVDRVLSLPADERELLDRLHLAGDDGSTARTIGVLAGAGGAGATTLAASICVTAARGGAAPALVDADPLSGGVDLLLGAEAVPGARWPDLAGARGPVPSAVLDEALPRVAGIRLVSGGRVAAGLVPDAVTAVLAALRRAGDLVVVDLPRCRDAATDIAAASCDELLVVTTAQVRAVAATALAAADLASLCTDVRLVVRTAPRWRLRPTEVSAALGLPLAGVIETDPGIGLAADCGDLAAALRRSRLGELAAVLVDPSREPGRVA